MRNCGHCGGETKRESIVGKTFHYMEESFIILNDIIQPATCQKCGEIGLKGSEISIIDNYLQHYTSKETGSSQASLAGANSDPKLTNMGTPPCGTTSGDK